jgi:hypothetical protein
MGGHFIERIVVGLRRRVAGHFSGKGLCGKDRDGSRQEGRRQQLPTRHAILLRGCMPAALWPVIVWLSHGNSPFAYCGDNPLPFFSNGRRGDWFQSFFKNFCKPPRSHAATLPLGICGEPNIVRGVGRGGRQFEALQAESDDRGDNRRHQQSEQKGFHMNALLSCPAGAHRRRAPEIRDS